MAKRFRYNLACEARTYEGWEITAENVTDAVEQAEFLANEGHGEVAHRVTKIEEIADLPTPVVEKRYALRVNEEYKSARLLIRPRDGVDRWYDLENATHIETLARDFRAFEAQGFEYVSEDELDD